MAYENVAGKESPYRKGSEERRDAPIRPNMLLINLAATSSTLDRIDFSHCIFNNSNYTNSLFNQSNLKGVSVQRSSFDGSGFQRCSFRGVIMQNCDIEGLVINGVRVGDLLEKINHSSGGD